MLAAVRSAAVAGIEAYPVTVEVDAAPGLPQFTIVGLPTGAVKESRERVTAALLNGGFTVPPRRITVNLAPADTRKDGSSFDVPMAVGILIATGQLPATAAEHRLFVGELGLDGTVRAVRGALTLGRLAAAVRCTLVLPPPNVAEAALVRRVRLAAPPRLTELVSQLRRGELMAAASPELRPVPSAPDDDFADVVGQASAKRALEVAAAGGHNVLLTWTWRPRPAILLGHPYSHPARCRKRTLTFASAPLSKARETVSVVRPI